MSIEQLKQRIPDFRQGRQAQSGADDGGRNTIATEQIRAVAGERDRNPIVTAAMEAAAGTVMTPAAVDAAKSAASVMPMNNVYYRFVHLASNPEYKTRPARLRMNWLAIPLWTEPILSCGPSQSAQSTGAGPVWTPMRRRCGKSGFGSDTIQSSNGGRFAAIVQSVAVAMEAARHDMARRRCRSNPPFPQPFAPALSGQARGGRPSKS